MRRLPLLCAFLLLTGCYDSRFGERSGGEEPEPATATIAQLRQLYAGTTFVIATDVVVSGRVNTSDAGGKLLPHVLRRGRWSGT